MLRRIREPARAVESYEESRRVLEALVKDNPAVGEYREIIPDHLAADPGEE
jgi:hypothetical protein